MSSREKTVLCFGDSNTWGSIPGQTDRYGPDIRWPRRLESQLMPGFRVIEEGLCGRTVVYDDPIDGHRAARPYLDQCLRTHQPIDLVIVMLGTNDLKARYGLGAYDIAEGVRQLCGVVLQSGAGLCDRAPELLILAPPPLGPVNGINACRYRGADEKSRHLGDHYRRVADELGCAFVVTEGIAHASLEDGVHWLPDSHINLADALADVVRDLI